MTNLLISTVIPVYNGEQYIAEAIESIVGQSIDFVKNIELIIVDDGSTDNSANICKQYVSRYPDNVQYIYQKNAGVSKARNTGMTVAKGEYVHFLDSDDSISKNFYGEAIQFLQRHQNEVDFVAAKLKFFDANIDSHPLNYKFRKTRIIDVGKEPDKPILHLATCVFRRASLSDLRFDDRLSVSEDVKLLAELLLQKKKYGVVKRPTYYYRKRSTGSSAIDTKEKNKSYYLDTPTHVYEYILDAWRLSGDARPMEYAVLYDISYRLDQKEALVLNAKQQAAYKKKILAILRMMNDEVVTSHRFLSIYKKVYILKLIHGDNFYKNIQQAGRYVYFKNICLYDRRKTKVYLDFFRPENGRYILEGYVEGYGAITDDVVVRMSGKEQAVTRVGRKQREQSFLGDVYYDGGAFEVNLEAAPGDSVQVFAAGAEVSLQTKRFTRLAEYSHVYRCDSDRIITKTPRSLRIHRYSRIFHAVLEFRQLIAILTHWKFYESARRFTKMTRRNFAQLSWKMRAVEVIKPLAFVVETVVFIPRAIVLRVTYHAVKLFQRRPVWIVSDRGMAAGDNGEALFRYIMARSDCPGDVYFALSKKSKDFERMQSLGPVLDYGSLRYKLKFLLAEKIISSHADAEVTNPFSRQINHFVDLYTFGFIFLQHGITKDDVSSWLNRFEKDIKLFITAGRPEYDSILSDPYYYSKKQVLLSGFPRYDFLENKPNKKIIIAPTYRAQLLRANTDAVGARPYDVTFKQSAYFRFYNSLINDERIVAALRKRDVTAELFLHPNFVAQLDDFQTNEAVSIASYPYDYKQALSEGSLLVTDYSSVAFDFGYLRKPVIYTQFDRNTFFEEHVYRPGYYSYDEDGFGPVYSDYEETIHGIVDAIRTDIVLDDVYRKRIDRFFAYDDKLNSMRVYQELMRYG